MKKTLFLFPVVLLPALAGCALNETSYVRPQTQVPATWSVEAQGEKARLSDWWMVFGDEELNLLVDEVLKVNNDLAAAALTAKAARLRADLAFDQFLPDLSATATASNSRGLRKGASITRAYTAKVNASYEVDLWGKLSAEADSADWEAKATEEDREAARVALIGTTVELYWKIAYLNERISLSKADIASAKKTLQLVEVQHAAGAVSGIDEAEAEKNLASLEASHTQLLQQKAETSNAFDILFNGPPGTRKANPAALYAGKIPELPADVPASLLERRPDLRAAELRLRETLADEDATRASYMPTFSLTGSFGSTSAALSRVFLDPVGTLGAGIALPFLNWFDMRNNIGISEAQYEEAVVNFRQTLYSALADVENALSLRKNDAEQGIKLASAATNALKVSRMYEIQYRQGYVSLQTLLDAQDSVRSAKASLLENRLAQITDCVTLYKALGGDAQK